MRNFLRMPPSPVRPYWNLLLLFVILGFAADFLYPIASQMGQINLPVSPGEILRGIQIYILVLVLGKLRCTRKDLLFAFLFIGLGAIFFLSYGGGYELTQRFVWAIKLLYLILMIGLVRKILYLDPRMADRIASLLMWTTLFFIVIPIFLSYAGILGYRSYGESSYRTGYKGFMYAKNSLSVDLISAICLPLVFSKNIFIRYLFIGAGFLVGTKAAAGAGLGALLLFAYLTLRSSRNAVNKFVITALFVTIAYYSYGIYDTIQSQNLAYYIGKFQQTDNFWLVLTSGRWAYFTELPELMRSINILEWIFGTPVPKFNEIDYTALFTRFGLLGVIWYIMFFGRHLRYSLYNLRQDHKQIVVGFTLLMIFAHSALGGHVIGNAVVAYPVATIIALNEYYFKNPSKIPD